MLRRLLTASSTRLGALQIVVLCVSLFSQVFIARRFGAGHELDRYYAVLGTALGVMGSLSVGTNYILPPKIVRALARGQWEEARLCASESGWRIVVWIGAVAFAGGASMIVAGALGSRIAGAPRAGLIALGWLVAAGSAVAGLLGAINTAHRRVATSLVASAFPPAILLLALAVVRNADATTMFAGMLAGTTIQCAVLAVAVRRLIAWKGTRLRWDMRENAYLLTAMSGAACFSSYSVVDAFLAPSIGAGALTLQSLGQRLIVAFGAVLSAGAFALAPDDFGRLIEGGRPRDAYRLFLRTCLILVGMTLLTCALTPWLGRAILQLLFAGGNFQVGSVDRLTMLVAILLVGCGAMLSSAIGFRLLYALSAGGYVAAASLVWLLIYLLSALGFVNWDVPYPLAWAYVMSWWAILGWLAIFVGYRTATGISPDMPQENR